MAFSSTVEFFAGGALIFLGVLFIIGLGLDPQDLLTDAIFIGFGALLVSNAHKNSKKKGEGSTVIRETNGKQPSRERRRKKGPRNST